MTKSYLNAWDKAEIEGDKIFFKPPRYQKVQCHFDFEGTPIINPMFGMLYYNPSELKKDITPATEKQKEYLMRYGYFSKRQVERMTYEDAVLELTELFSKERKK